MKDTVVDEVHLSWNLVDEVYLSRLTSDWMRRRCRGEGIFTDAGSGAGITVAVVGGGPGVAVVVEGTGVTGVAAGADVD